MQATARARARALPVSSHGDISTPVRFHIRSFSASRKVNTSRRNVLTSPCPQWTSSAMSSFSALFSVISLTSVPMFHFWALVAYIITPGFWSTGIRVLQLEAKVWCSPKFCIFHCVRLCKVVVIVQFCFLFLLLFLDGSSSSANLTFMLLKRGNLKVRVYLYFRSKKICICIFNLVSVCSKEHSTVKTAEGLWGAVTNPVVYSNKPSQNLKHLRAGDGPVLHLSVPWCERHQLRWTGSVSNRLYWHRQPRQVQPDKPWLADQHFSTAEQRGSIQSRQVYWAYPPHRWIPTDFIKN